MNSKYFKNIVLVFILLLIGLYFNPFKNKESLSNQEDLLTLNKLNFKEDQWNSVDGIKQYKSIILENGLRIVLIHDPRYKKSAATMAFKVGSSENNGKEGLAHFNEHMLFIATEKYPETNSFNTFLSSKGGGSNAFTGSEYTGYYFSIQGTDGFNEAADRFSRFFIDPLYPNEFVEKEKNAVNSENNIDANEDGRIVLETNKLILSEQNPLSRFSVGTLDTMKDFTVNDLKEFFNEYYIAENMVGSLISSLPLDQLENIAKEVYKDVHTGQEYNRNYDLPYYKEDLNFPIEFDVKTKKELYEMELIFQGNKSNSYYTNNHTYIPGIFDNIFLNNQDNSLKTYLKRQGLISSINAYIYTNQYEPLVSLDIVFTKKGFSQRAEVLTYIFDYINLIKKEGYKKYIFTEYLNSIELDKINKEFSPLSASNEAYTVKNLVIDKVNNLQNAYEDYEIAYDPDAFDEYVNHFSYENLKVVNTFYKDFDGEIKTNLNGYDIEYTLTEQVRDEYKQALNSNRIHDFLAYPKANPYSIGQKDIEIATELEPSTAKNILDPSEGEFYYKKDDLLKTSKTSISMNFINPMFYNNKENLLRDDLLKDIYISNFASSISELMSFASTANLSFSITSNSYGVLLDFTGYKVNLFDFINDVSKELKDINITEEEFNERKETIKRNLNQITLDNPVSLAFDYFNTLIRLGEHTTTEETLNTLDELSLNDLKDFAKNRLYSEGFIYGSAYGYVEEDELKNNLDQIIANIGQKKIPFNDEYIYSHESNFEPNKSILFKKDVENSNNGILLTYFNDRNGYNDIEKYLIGSLVSKYISSDFFTTLRTQEKLAYSLNASYFSNRTKVGPYYYVVSQEPLTKVYDRVLNWFNQRDKLIDELDEETFLQLKNTLLGIYDKAPLNLEQAHTRLNGARLTRRLNKDDYYGINVEFLNNLTLEQTKKVAKELFTDNPYQMSFFMRGKDRDPIDNKVTGDINLNSDSDISELREKIGFINE